MANSTAGIVATFCRSQGYAEPEPEYRFHGTRKWRFDLAWPDEMVAVEFQGGAWTQGRHTRGQGFTADCEKFSTAAAMGWRVLPVTHQQVEAGLLWGWLDMIFGEG